MEDTEESILCLEGHVTELFSAAVTRAYWGALAAGHHVLQHEGDGLLEVSPEGRRRVIKQRSPMTEVEPGSRLVPT